MKSADLTKDVLYVEKAFDKLRASFAQNLDSVFKDDGQFSSLLREHFGEDGKVVKDLFDPHKDGTPLFALRRALDENLSEIKEKLAVNETKKQMIEKSPQKGFEFEEWCEQKLDEIAKFNSDKLENTGKELGQSLNRKVGDFVLTLSDTGKKVVFEMKDAKISLPQIQKQLSEAMENRKADYGILVARHIEDLPKPVGWFNEYDGNQLVCAVGSSESDALIDGEIIRLACSWARTRLRIESAKEKKLEPSFIIEKVDAVRKQIEEMMKIKTQCTNISKSNDKIRDILTDAESEMNAELDEIIKSLEPKD